MRFHVFRWRFPVRSTLNISASEIDATFGTGTDHFPAFSFLFSIARIPTQPWGELLRKLELLELLLERRQLGCLVGGERTQLLHLRHQRRGAAGSRGVRCSFAILDHDGFDTLRF